MNIFLNELDVLKYDENSLELLEVSVVNEMSIHHIKNVMRKKEGNDIYLNDTLGNKYLGIISKIDKNYINLDIIQKLENNESNILVTIYQAVAKSDRLEYFLEKSTELGVNNIVLTNFSRNVVKIENDKKLNKKLERWEKITEAASKQSRRNIIPKISYLDNLKNEDYTKYDKIYILYENEENNSLKNILNNDKEQLNKIITKEKRNLNIAIIVGPEGGISKEEIIFLKSLNNTTSVLLGPRILRTETAGITFLSILQYEYGDF